MSDFKEEIYLTGGLDSDSDEKFVKQGDYVDALNISKFYDGDAGLVTNADGNSEIENTYLPAGTNKCIGWCQYEETNSILFFNYNSNDNHGIYRLLKDSDTFQKILHNESILAFSSDCINLQADVIGGILYWNEGQDINGDYINPPRKLNIEKARRHTNSLSGDKYADITEYVLSVIKPPYLGYLNAVCTEDTTWSDNSKFIGRSYYKFAIQLVYDDYEKSVLGNYSNVVETFRDEDNYIAIRFYYQSMDGLVTKLKFYYTKDFNKTPFLATTIDVTDTDNIYNSDDSSAVSSLSDGNYYVYRYYGTPTGTVYNGNSNQFDNVPSYANTQLLTDNRLFYGGASFDLGDVSEGGWGGFGSYVPLFPRGGGPSLTYNWTAFSSSKTDGTTEYSISVANIASTILAFVATNSTNFIRIQWEGSCTVSGSSNGYVSLHLEINCRKIAPYWSYDKIVEYITDNSRVYVIDGSANEIDGTLSNTGSDPTFNLKGEVTDDGNLGGLSVTYNIMRVDKANNLAHKSLSKKTYALVYMDKYGRTLGYQPGDYDFYDTPERIAANGLKSETTYPEEDITYFFYFGIPNLWSSSSNVHYVSLVSSDNLDFTSVWQMQDPTYASGDQTLTYPSAYTFIEGDLLRIIGENKLWSILSQDEDYIYMPDNFDFTTNDDIEILRPRIGEDVIYNEIRTFNVYGGIPTYDVVLGYLVPDGDVWLNVNRDDDYIFEQFVDDGGKAIKITGRPFVERPEYNIDEYSNIYYSLKYFDNTEVNGLNSFISTNREELNDENGSIYDLKRLGEVVYAVQRREITSFYLGKEMLRQASTGNLTTDTSKILGGKRESAFDYGSVFQTSKMDNSVYGYDIYKGVFWMNGYNGVQIISGKDDSGNYKMDAYFKAKSKSLLESGIANITVKIGVDKPNDTIYVTFIDSNDSDNDETIAYHRPTNRWISKYSFIPESYAWLDDKFYSLKSGKLYEHNYVSADKCTYYGTAYDSYIQVVSHANPNIEKVFNTIAVHSNKKWTIDPIEIEANSTYTNGMYSKILDSQLVLEEGVYKAAFNKNQKTRSSSATNYDLYEGEDLRGKVVKVKLTNSDTTKAEIFKIDINSEPSP